MKNKDILAETNKLFDMAVDKLNLDKDLSRVLRVPYREIKVEIPVRDLSGNLYLYSGYRVQHNGARGPYYGGINIEQDIDIETIMALASRTVWKTGLMNIPFGGAYGGININTAEVPIGVVNAAIRDYILKISALIGPYRDVIAQGINADDKIMACVMDEYGKKFGYSPAVAAGKPEALNGTVGRKTALVSSSYYLLDLVSKNMQIQIQSLSLALSIDAISAINFIDYLNYLGCKLVAISDANGAVINHDGFNLEDLKSHILLNKTVNDYPHGDKIIASDIIGVDCDILLLGTDATVINADNANKVQARIVVELADAIVSLAAESILFNKEITVIPDLLVTAGETIVDYFEWIQNIQQFKWDYDQINEEMAKYINDGFKLVTDLTIKYQVSYRLACYMAGISRTAEATRLRGYI